MFGLFRDPVGEGVKSGLDEAFSPGGGAYKALGRAFAKALEPIAEELKHLRYVEARYKWHPLDRASPWVFDGRPMLLYRDGDLIFGCYQPEDGDSPGYWDADQEDGGQPIEPAPTHFYILRKTPALPAAAPGTQPQGEVKTKGNSNVR